MSGNTPELIVGSNYSFLGIAVKMILVRLKIGRLGEKSHRGLKLLQELERRVMLALFVRLPRVLPN